jgi:hypothetical protein
MYVLLVATSTHSAWLTATCKIDWKSRIFQRTLRVGCTTSNTFTAVSRFVILIFLRVAVHLDPAISMKSTLWLAMHIYSRMRVHIHMHIWVCTFVHMCACTYTLIRMHIWVCTCAFSHANMRVHTHVHTLIPTCTCTCTHKHTHIHMQVSRMQMHVGV